MEYVHLPKDAKTEGYPTRGAKQLLRAKAHYAEPADSCLEYVRLSYKGDRRRMHEMKNGSTVQKTTARNEERIRS